MNLKIECSCGARFSFDVEPVDGRMPAAVHCPVCQADRTEAANQLIAQNLAGSAAAAVPRLRVQMAASPAPAAEPEVPESVAEYCGRHPASVAVEHCVVCGKPVCMDCMKAFGFLCSIACRNEAKRQKIKVPVFHGQRGVAEEAALRRSGWLIGGIAALLLAAVVAWGWYAFYAYKPHLSAWLDLKGAGPVHAQFLTPDRILVVSSKEAALWELSFKKAVWTTKFEGDPDDAAAGSASARPRVIVGGSPIWIGLGHRVVCLDYATGAIRQSIPIEGRLISFEEGLIWPSPADASLLAVSAPSETRRIALRINMTSGEVARQEISVPRNEKQMLPDDLPPNVAPTAGVLMSQALEEQKLNKPLNAVSSQFFSAGNNLVELRVKLLEAKVNYVQSIKPSGPSHLNDATSVSTSVAAVAQETFNDIKRSQTGGVKQVDESRYQVRLRRWTSATPAEWTGEVSGAPCFFSLPTVDLLTAGKNLIVFDKQGALLFQSQLAYPVSERFTSNNADGQPAPAAQRDPNTLYFLDQGVLTAFALPTGEPRWRLTTIGGSAIQFDDQGMLYVNSTTAAPEDLQYSDTVRLDRIRPVLLKVNPATGKILWKAEDRGEQCLESGKRLYAVSVSQGGLAIGNALSEALGQPPQGASVAFHLYRMDPANGETLWDLYYPDRPENLGASGNHILMRLGDNLELLKYLSF